VEEGTILFEIGHADKENHNHEGARWALIANDKSRRVATVISVANQPLEGGLELLPSVPRHREGEERDRQMEVLLQRKQGPEKPEWLFRVQTVSCVRDARKADGEFRSMLKKPNCENDLVQHFALLNG